jgi:hypothetical protein
MRKNASFAVDQKEKRVLQNQLLFQCMAQEKSIFLQIAIKGAKTNYAIYLSSNWVLLLLVVYFLPFEIAAKK